MAHIINGKAIAATMVETIALEVQNFFAERGVIPGLVVILIGEDPASQVYVNRKAAQIRKAGMVSFEHRLLAETH